MNSVTHPATMKAVFLEQGKLVTRKVRVPEPGPSEVLVRISAAPVNPSDLARLRNADPEYDLSSFIPGLEGSGTVVAAGQGLLPHLWLGRRVACSSAYNTSGTWAEFMVTHAGMCFPLGKSISDEQGSMTLVNPLTAIAFFQIVKTGRHKALINNAAASSLGRMVELLGNKNKIPVINIVRSAEQAEKLLRSGSRYVLNSSAEGFTEDLGSMAEKLKATILFDSVCSPQLTSMIDVLPANSSVVIYGNLSLEETICINPRTLIDKNIFVSAFYLASQAKKNGLLKNMMDLIKVRKLMSSGMEISINARFPLEKAQEAIDTYLGKMSAGKVLLIPGAV